MWKLWFGINFDEPGSTLWCPLYFPVWQWPIRIRVGGSTKKRESNNNKSLRKGQDSWEWTKKVANWSGIHLIENCSKVNLFIFKYPRISWEYRPSDLVPNQWYCENYVQIAALMTTIHKKSAAFMSSPTIINLWRSIKNLPINKYGRLPNQSCLGLCWWHGHHIWRVQTLSHHL